MNWNKLRIVGKPLLLLAGLLFLAVFIVQHWEESSVIILQTNLVFFVLSIVIALADNLLFCRLFYWLMKKHDLDASFSQIGEMFFFGQLAKYIPGRFWNFLYQSTYFDKPNAIRSIFAANLELMGLSIWRNLILGIALTLVLTKQWQAAALILLGCLGYKLLLQHNWLVWIIRLLPFKKSLPYASRSTTPTSVASVVAFLGTTLLYLTANYVLLVLGFGFDFSEAVLFTAMFSLAWIVGVIAFVVPAGIGVREAVFVALAASVESPHSLETLATIAIIYRFWQIFHELGAIGLGLYFRQTSK